MSAQTAIDCGSFDAQLEDLAVGDIPEPARGRLMAHADSCVRCRAELDGMLAVTDRLLELAPSHEPPPGFETRVLTHLGAEAPERPSLSRWGRIAAVAAVVAAAAVAGGAIAAAALDGREDDRRGEDAPVAAEVVRAGVIVDAAGRRTGTVRLVDAVHPYAFVVIDRPRYGPGGEVSCELALADGRAESIGSWGYDDVEDHVWAIGIDDDLLDAVTMRVLGPDGSLLASADLTQPPGAVVDLTG